MLRRCLSISTKSSAVSSTSQRRISISSFPRRNRKIIRGRELLQIQSSPHALILHNTPAIATSLHWYSTTNTSSISSTSIQLNDAKENLENETTIHSSLTTPPFPFPPPPHLTNLPGHLISYPTSRTHSVHREDNHFNDASLLTNTNELRKDELMEYIQKVVSYDIESILIANEVDNAHGGGVTKHVQKRCLREQMANKIHFDESLHQMKQQRKERQKQKHKQEKIKDEISPSATSTVHLDNDNIHDNLLVDDDSNHNTTMQTVHLPTAESSFMSLIEEKEDEDGKEGEYGHNVSNNHHYQDDSQNINDNVVKEGSVSSLLKNDNNVNEIKNYQDSQQQQPKQLSSASFQSLQQNKISTTVPIDKSKNLFDLLDDDDYGIDDVTIGGNNFINSNHHNQDTEPNTPTTMTKVIDVPDEKETSLLSLLSQGFTSSETDQSNLSSPTTSESTSTSFMSLLDETFPTSSVKDKVNPSSSVSPSPSSSLLNLFNNPNGIPQPSSPSSLLNLMDDLDTFESNAISKNQALSSGHGDYDNSDSLLDLLDSDDFDSIESRKEPSSNYQSNTTTTTTTRNNDSLMSMLDDSESSSTSSPSSNLRTNIDDNSLRGLDTNESLSWSSPSSNLDNTEEDNSLMGLLDGIGSSSPSPTLINTEGDNSLMGMLDKNGFNDIDFTGDVKLDKSSFNESFPVENLNAILLRSKHLLAIMHKKHWRQYRLLQNEKQKKIDFDDNNDNNVIETDNPDIFEETVYDEALDDSLTDVQDLDNDDSSLENETIVSLSIVDELIFGNRTNKFHLTTDELNMILVFVATSNITQKSEYLLKIYLHMEELSLSGVSTAAPNADTYSILINVFDRSENTTAVAVELAARMMKQRGLNLTADNEMGNESNFGELSASINDASVYAAMRVYAKCLDLHKAEILMKWASSADDILFTSTMYNMMLRIYKGENEQEKALELIRLCIKESSTFDTKGVNSVLSSAISWPISARNGRKIATAYFYQCLTEMVFEEADILNVDLNMWKNLFFRTSRIAQVESFDMWALVHKCCNEILNHPDMNTFKMDPKIIKVGLQTAEVMNDPELAAKIVSKIDVNNRNTALPLNVYVKLITMCVQNQKSESAKKILQHCKQIGIPTENLRKLKLIVLNGYAQLGDLENTKKMFDDMDSKESEIEYAAMIQAYGMNKMKDESFELLTSMRNGLFDDGIQPGISSYAACMFAALKSQDWDKILQINDMMIESEVEANSTTLQSILVATMQKGDRVGSLKAIEKAVESNMVIDGRTFMLCSKYLLPTSHGTGDIGSMRQQMRSLIDENPTTADGAMELNRTLRECERYEKKEPNNIQNRILLQQERERLWRNALVQAIHLSKSNSNN